MNLEKKKEQHIYHAAGVKTNNDNKDYVPLGAQLLHFG
jgi:hypothetical protein